MNASRPVAALAAVAIGFGVTLAGVAFTDDDAASDSELVDVTDDPAGDGSLEELDDDLPDGDEPASDPDVDADASIEPMPDDDNDDDIDGDGALPDTVPDDGPDEETDPAIDESPDTVPPPETPTETPGGTPDAPTPRPPTTEDDGGVFDDLGEVECVDTISVEFFDGDRFDFVVAERGTGGTWLVLEVDGPFELSQDDPGIVRVTEVRREVLFLEGAAVEFFDTCDDLGGSLGTESEDDGLEQGLIRDFPCSSSAQSSVRALLDDTEIQAFDDFDELLLAVAIDLSALGRSSESVWLDQLTDIADSFRTFDDGCSALIESELQRGALLCAAPLVVSGDEIAEFLVTVAPLALDECLYDLTLDGDR